MRKTTLIIGIIIGMILFILSYGIMFNRLCDIVKEEGRQAYINGLSDASNPYRTPPESRKWIEGYLEAKNGKSP